MINERTYSTKLAIERIKDYCSIEDKCQLDIIKKMEEWGILKISQDHILEILIKEKYLDEERYSRSYCRGKFRMKKWGKIKIIHALRKKKISKVSITKGLEEINDSEYKIELEKQYQKKKKTTREKNHFIKQKKIATYLISKGYESNLVWDKLKKSTE